MKRYLLLLIITISTFCSAQKERAVFPATTMVNDVMYKDSKFNRLNIGCGFLLKYKTDTFAITAKHIIIVAKTDAMKTTNFEGDLKEWRMYRKDDKQQYVTMGELINKDTTDSLTWDFMMSAENYYDFLIFKIKSNHSNITPLELSTEKPELGDTLYNLGWSYNDKEGPQRVYKYTFHESKGLRFNMRKIIAPKNGGGLSGSPVINTDGKVVGIISGMDQDPVTKEEFSSPRHIDYLIKFFEEYYKNKE
ncbi:trypsin-like serine protease [Labilibacter marinus]|uniref:trypsin-like serine protease n=1 Tax=Labilibacter marinus TaxID=1477105 RepID=UPI00082D288F|nr:trypsin-like serine protease [Labilibacter marinus]